MNQFTVPQFIDVEDKIIGSVTARQFIIMLAGFILEAVYYRLFDFSLFVVVSIVNIIIFAVFAFAKINGRPFHFFVLNLLQTIKKPNLRVWNHYASKTGDEYTYEVPAPEAKPIIPDKGFTTSRLAELSLVVDTRGAYRGEIKNDKNKIKAIIDGNDK